MLSWANRFTICCFLDNHNYQSQHHSVECLVGAGALKVFGPGEDFFQSLSTFSDTANDYIFGHFNYDLKNKTEAGLTSEHTDNTEFPEFFLYIPEVVLLLNENILQIGVFSADAALIYRQLIEEEIEEVKTPPVEIKPRVTKSEYLDAVEKLKGHIHLGDCYVINYCQEFYASAAINPLALFLKLGQLSPNPFGAYYRLNDKYLLCASPERFIKKERQQIISQPIKGTSPRNHADPSLDELNKQQLTESKKERSENVMVVDLVRNDLGKFCQPGSVKVDELFGIHSFPNVHQMISTVSGQINDGVEFGDIIKATFPMGSMTGAPKRRVMELTEKYEHSKRGIYSGTVGYISPNKDFDFNVVIRSLVYNAASQYLSYHTGSAITAYCNAESEYEECLLKGNAIKDLLAGKG